MTSIDVKRDQIDFRLNLTFDPVGRSLNASTLLMYTSRGHVEVNRLHMLGCSASGSCRTGTR